MERIGERVLNWASVLDEQAREQALATASVAAVDGHVALMADAHLGMGCTVGSVIPTREAIIPAAVGVDIGCGVIATQTRLAAADLPDSLDPLLDRWAATIPAGLGYWHADEDPAWRSFVARHGLPESVQADARLRDKAPRQFGTLGSGNHFLELCTDEAGTVWLMLHSGSRGPGNTLAMRHIAAAKGVMRRMAVDLPDPELAYVAQGTPEFDAYIADLLWAQAYAFGNRERMMRVALDALAAATGRAPDLEVTTINNHHNHARRERHCLTCSGNQDSDSPPLAPPQGDRLSRAPSSQGGYRRGPRSYDELVRAAQEIAQEPAPSPVGAHERILLDSLAGDLARALERSRSAGGSAHPYSSRSGRRSGDAASLARMIASMSSELHPGAEESLRRRWDTRLAQLSDPNGRVERSGSGSDRASSTPFSPAAQEAASDGLTRTGAADPSPNQLRSGYGGRSTSSDRNRTRTNPQPSQHVTTPPPCGHHGKDLWITRKGAISARDGELGVIPGSMGTGSFVVRGLGNPQSYMSAAHGAGRAMSRRQARRTFGVDDLERAMAGRTWLRTAAAQLIDEIPGAYKDLDTVMADQTDLVEVVHRLETLVNYKGVEKGSRRGKA